MLIVYNPSSGSYVKEDLKQFKSDAIIYKTTGKNDISSIRRILKEKKIRKVVVIGGDGTVSSVAQLLVGANISLAIIPRGSTNGLFYDLTDQERPLNKRKKKRIDAIKFDDKYCFHIAGFGLDAYVIKKSESSRLKGFFKYFVSFFRSLLDFKKHAFKVNGKKIKTLILVIANGRSYGVGRIINPYGNVDDNKFEICTLKEQIPYKSAKIENLNGAPFHIDGEFIGHPKEVHAKIIPKALTVLI